MWEKLDYPSEVLKYTEDITLNKIGRLEAERKWQLALKTYSPFSLNTVPSSKDSGVTPFVITSLQLQWRQLN